MSVQMEGLASGIKWQQIIDDTIKNESVTKDRLEIDKENTQNQKKAVEEVISRLGKLKSSVESFDTYDEAVARKTSVTLTDNPVVSATVDSNAISGEYEFQITQLATKSTRVGTSDVGAGLSGSADVSGVTVGTMPSIVAVTAGTFSINGQKITVDTTDSLQDVFDAINTATSGSVTGSYNSGTDKVTLSSTQVITVGSAADTSNFLQAIRLIGDGTKTPESTHAIGIVKTASAISNANLSTTPTSGSFKLNGVSFTYNVSSDSLSTVMQNINASDAGVNISYDAINDRFTLTNKKTGNTDISLEEVSGNLMTALGLDSGSSTLNLGLNATFKLNQGATLTSTSNEITAASHGVTGLKVNALFVGTDTVTVSEDVDAIKAKLDDFIYKYNDIQDYIADKSKFEITKVKGTDKVSKGLLTDNSPVKSLALELRRMLFSEVTSLSGGSIKRMVDLGLQSTIEFTGKTSNKIEFDSPAFIVDKIAKYPVTIAKLLSDTTDGVAKIYKDYINKVSKTGLTNAEIQKKISDGKTVSTSDYPGTLVQQKYSYDDRVRAIDRKIDLETRRLEKRREDLKKQYIEMEKARQQMNMDMAAMAQRLGMG